MNDAMRSIVGNASPARCEASSPGAPTRESPADILSSLLFRFIAAVAMLVSIPLMIAAMLAFEIYDGIACSRAVRWLLRRRA